MFNRIYEEIPEHERLQIDMALGNAGFMLVAKRMREMCEKRLLTINPADEDLVVSYTIWKQQLSFWQTMQEHIHMLLNKRAGDV